MLIVYDSKTGNVKRFTSKLNMDTIQISNSLIVQQPFALITYTTGIGNVPNTTLNFLEFNHKYLKGVATSGNRNWGMNYGKAADIISKKYDVPIISKFELSGTKGDVERFKQEVLTIVQSDTEMDSTEQ